MFRIKFLSIMIFIYTSLIIIIPLSAQEENEKIIKSDGIGKEIKAEIFQSQNLLKHQTASLDSEKIEEHQNFVYKESGTAFYFELLGKGFYSFNVDYRKNKSEAMSLGIQQVENAFIPSLMYYRFRGETYRTEIGGGFSGIFDDGFASVMIHGVYGYRYQKKNGPLFRISFVPFIGIPFKSDGRFVIMPWVGISLGYSL